MWFREAKFITLSGFLVVMACAHFAPVETLQPVKNSLRFEASPSGTEIMKEIVTKGDHLREGILYRHILSGHIPTFLQSFVRISFSARDGEQRVRRVEIDVAPDYLAVGKDDDYFYVPLQPATAVAIADQYSLILPTKKLVDTIHKFARVQLRPITLPPGRSMSGIERAFDHTTMIRESDIQQNLRGVLTAGHKKDIVLSHSLRQLEDRLAIYGWHNIDGIPIQKLNHDHDFRYADYSHGVRYISRNARIDGEPIDLAIALSDYILSPLFSDEGTIDSAAYVPRWIRQFMLSH